MSKPSKPPARQGFYAQLPAAVIREIKTQARERSKNQKRECAQWEVLAPKFANDIIDRKSGKRSGVTFSLKGADARAANSAKNNAKRATTPFSVKKGRIVEAGTWAIKARNKKAAKK